MISERINKIKALKESIKKEEDELKAFSFIKTQVFTYPNYSLDKGKLEFGSIQTEHS